MATAVSSSHIPTGRGAAGRFLAWACGLYLVLLLTAAALLYFAADRWWPATLLLFGPRWLLALPFVVLLPASAILRPRISLLLAGSLLLLWPLEDFSFPLRAAPTNADHFSLRVLTCNTDGRHLDAPALRRLLDEAQPNVVALQEWRSENEPAIFGGTTWELRPGKGLCLASRYPVSDGDLVRTDPPWRDVAARFDLQTPAGTLHFFNLHLDTPRDGLEAMIHSPRSGRAVLASNTAGRRQQSERARQLVNEAVGPFLVAGDFNLPAESLIFRDNWGDLTDAFASGGFGLGHTKFTRWYGVRIDHILCGPGWRCRRCWVGPDVGSDHRPLLADLEWAGTSPE